MEIINNFDTTITSTITDSDTTLEVAVAPVATVSALEPLALTIFTSAAKEIVYCTNITGTTLTVSRAQEGTTAVSWAGDTPIAGMLTAGVIEKVVAKGLGILESISGSVEVAADGIINLPNIGIMVQSTQSITLPNGSDYAVTSVGSDDQITISGHVGTVTHTGTFAAVVPNGRKLRYYNGYSVWRT